MSRKHKRHADTPGEQPDQRVRRESERPAPEYQREHAETTDSPRWGEAGSSEEERGYPPEGERR